MWDVAVTVTDKRNGPALEMMVAYQSHIKQFYFTFYIKKILWPNTDIAKWKPLSEHASVQKRRDKNSTAPPTPQAVQWLVHWKPSSLHECRVWSVGPWGCQWAAAVPISVRHSEWPALTGSAWAGWAASDAPPPTFLRTCRSGSSGRWARRSPLRCSWRWADRTSHWGGCRLLSGCQCTSSCPCS